jgi:hypothetical protein
MAKRDKTLAWFNYLSVRYLWGRYTCSVRIYGKRFQRQHIAIQFFSCVHCVCSTVIVSQGCITAACSALMFGFYSTLTETESSLNMKCTTCSNASSVQCTYVSLFVDTTRYSQYVF